MILTVLAQGRLCKRLLTTVIQLLTICSIKLLTGELNPQGGQVNRSGRLRVYVSPSVLTVIHKLKPS